MIENLFPHTSFVGRTVPKKTFIEQLGVNAKLKGHFTNYMERITWVAKLAPSTIHVADGKTVHEIAVFEMAMKVKDCPADLCAFIEVRPRGRNTALSVLTKRLGKMRTVCRFPCKVCLWMPFMKTLCVK